MEREPVLMKKVLLAACGATLTVGALIPVGLSSAGADPASAATASAFGASIDLAGQDVLPPRGTATITLPPGGNDGPNALLLVPVEPVAVSGTASGQATATTASDIPTSLKQVTQAVPGPYNARAIGLIENLDVLTSVAGVGTSLVSASAVRGEAVGVCRGGAAQYSANSEIIDLNIGGTSIPLNAPLQSLIDAVGAVIDPLAMVVDIERNQVVVNADGASVVALRITVLGALNGVPIVDQEPLADIILGAAEVRGLRCGRVPQCSDTQDNDGDGKIDAQDPGCINDQGVFDPNDDDETDRLPRTAAVPNNSGGGELPRTGGTSTAPLAGGLAVLALGALTLRRRSQAAR